MSCKGNSSVAGESEIKTVKVISRKKFWGFHEKHN